MERNNIHILSHRRSPERRTACLAPAGSARSPDCCLHGARQHSGSSEENLGLAAPRACLSPQRMALGCCEALPLVILHPRGIAGRHSDSYILQLLGFAQPVAEEWGKRAESTGSEVTGKDDEFGIGCSVEDV